MAYAYHPAVAVKAVEELGNALLGFNDMEYANALLADPRMTNTKGIMASCGFTYKGIKYVRDLVSGNIPTLEAQKRALAFLGQIDDENRGKAA
ncbi:MAG: hypothetical protein MRY32_01065 [Rickettsiales bacterium]|nr:hypothetical protein [Rickettsiales bacterium]